MRLPIAWATAVAISGSLLLAGCGAGDPTGLNADRALHVTAGGSGQAYIASTLRSLPFSNSVTVALRETVGGQVQTTIYTLFGLNRLTMTEVPSAALVTFIKGLDPNTSSSTDLPAQSVGIMMHDGFNQALVGTNGVLAQDAPTIYRTIATGALVLEPAQSAAGVFEPQTSTQRQARWSTVTLDTSGGVEALVEGLVPYQVSQNVDQSFLGYAGNLGLLAQPSTGGGGPPNPPGGGGGGGGGGNPPEPPL